MSYTYKRSWQLLTLLANENTFKPIHYYAKAMHISQKSLNHDIKQLATLMQDQAYLIQKEPGKGIKLTKPFRFRLKHILQENLPIHRQIKILHYMILERQCPSIKELCLQYNVSKSSILLDLKAVEHKLMLKRASIKELESLEKRLTLHGVFIESLCALLPESLSLSYEDLLQELSCYYSKRHILQALQTLRQLYHQHQFLCNQPDFHNLFIVLLALLYEADAHPKFLADSYPGATHPTTQHAAFLPPMLKHPAFENIIGQQLTYSRFSPIQQKLCPNQEIKALAKLLLNVFAPKELQNPLFLNAIAQEYALLLLNANNSMHFSLHSHCNQTQQYSQVLAIGMLLLDYHLTQYHRKPLLKSALALLFRLITLIQQHSQPIAVYLCSNLPQPYHQLLATRLTRLLPASHYLVQLKSSKDLYKVLSNAALQPLVLTTYPLKHLPAYTLSSQLSIQDEFIILKECSQQSEYLTFYHASQPSHTYHLLDSLITPSLCFRFTHSSSRKQVFEQMAALFEQQHVSCGSLYQHLERQADELSIALPQGWLVVPIAANKVQQSAVAASSMDAPLRWTQYDVHHIIFVALTPSDQHLMPALLKELYQLLFTPEDWDCLLKEANAKPAAL